MITDLQELFVQFRVAHELVGPEPVALHQRQHVPDLDSTDRVELARMAAVHAVLPALDHVFVDHPHFGKLENVVIADAVVDLIPGRQVQRSFFAVDVLTVLNASMKVGAILVEHPEFFVAQDVDRGEVAPDPVHLEAVVFPVLIIFAV